MKNIILALLTVGFLHVAYAGDAPEAVTKVFGKKYSTAEKVKWTKEDGNYEAEFTLSGKRMSATFKPDGNWLETETTINIKDLPAAVADYVAKNHPKAKITEAAKIERGSIDVFLYEAEIKEDGKETDLILTEKGILTK